MRLNSFQSGKKKMPRRETSRHRVLKTDLLSCATDHFVLGKYHASPAMPVCQAAGWPGRAYSHRIPLTKLKCISPKRWEELTARRRGKEPGGARRVESARMAIAAGYFDLVREMSSPASPFTSACRSHFLLAPIRQPRLSSLRGYIDRGETQSVCSVTGVPVQQARLTLL
jgi:hypothetical protein